MVIFFCLVFLGFQFYAWSHMPKDILKEMALTYGLLYATLAAILGTCLLMGSLFEKETATLILTIMACIGGVFFFRALISGTGDGQGYISSGFERD